MVNAVPTCQRQQSLTSLQTHGCDGGQRSTEAALFLSCQHIQASWAFGAAYTCAMESLHYFKAFSNIYATLYGALCYIILYACGVCHMFCSSKSNSWLLMKEISRLAIISFEMTESSLPLFSQLCESSRWRRCSISPVELDLVDEHASESQLLFGAPSVTTVWLFENLLFVVCWQMLATRQQRRPLRTWRTPSRTLDL